MTLKLYSRRSLRAALLLTGIVLASSLSAKVAPADLVAPVSDYSSS